MARRLISGSGRQWIAVQGGPRLPVRCSVRVLVFDSGDYEGVDAFLPEARLSIQCQQFVEASEIKHNAMVSFIGPPRLELTVGEAVQLAVRAIGSTI